MQQLVCKVSRGLWHETSDTAADMTDATNFADFTRRLLPSSSGGGDSHDAAQAFGKGGGAVVPAAAAALQPRRAGAGTSLLTLSFHPEWLYAPQRLMNLRTR